MVVFRPCEIRWPRVVTNPSRLTGLSYAKTPAKNDGQGTADDPHPPLMCFCNEPLALRVSRTSKNPGRLFLGCKSQKCSFFQWADEPWSKSLCDRWAQVLLHLCKYTLWSRRRSCSVNTVLTCIINKKPKRFLQKKK